MVININENFMKQTLTENKIASCHFSVRNIRLCSLKTKSSVYQTTVFFYSKQSKNIYIFFYFPDIEKTSFINKLHTPYAIHTSEHFINFSCYKSIYNTRKYFVNTIYPKYYFFNDPVNGKEMYFNQNTWCIIM